MRPFTAIGGSRSEPPPTTATPSKSILRPSILGRRKIDHVSPDDIPPPPTKRRKVLIDEMNNEVIEFSGRSLDQVNQEVRRALEGHLQGQDSDYDSLKEMFATENRRTGADVGEDSSPKPQELKRYILALTNCVPLLKNRACNGLVRNILQVSWLGRDEEFYKVYLQLMAALVSSQGSYLSLVLTMMVEKFPHTRARDWSVPDWAAVSRAVMRERLHAGLRYLLKVFPAASSLLRTLIVSKFPFADDAPRTHVAYVKNLLRLGEYAEELDLDMIDLILQRLVAIDVQMQVDLEDLDDELTTSVAYALGQSSPSASWEGDEDAPDDDEDDNESVDSDESDLDEHEEKVRTVKGHIEKLDAVLDTLFEHYAPHFVDPESDDAYYRYALLVQSFGKNVLPTYKSRHTQFLLFHFGQLSDRLRDTFVGSLMHIFTSQTRPAFVRQAAATYLAGFVARGAHVPAELVRTIFNLLLARMKAYRIKHDAQARGPDMKRHQLYYAQVQAALYMFCFRWRDLIVSAPEFVDADDPASYLGHELGWMQGLKEELSSHVYCRMNPLKICSPAIVEEFATLTHKLGLMYIFPRVEENKRIRLSQFVSDTYGNGGALRDTAGGPRGEEDHQLDPYFPFDPYQLPVSKRWMQGNYVQYQSVPGLNVAVEDDDSDESGGEDGHDTDVVDDTATASEDEEEV
ncbi:RNA polymerase I-specific transcription initiation factor rrn3 [Sodiomyces alkalinus F11]|uniref:RNA polymerase I-specific transcription initiation factor rrn3 n=1 Tax=Sodiomyces alkalinus (strain CBS 110278 / VKM F-3762 / F11) TaxID=1314773 RepID=A0A3N2PZK2_SODAK|nr:RNA polymerase I-specific transcription initiation factor rrn3 [Sodiomyces alkalinus F11]ROT39785.1 RNA polymerase I-specific transcription initiation factor rrn3 [Sodiomyces alkalinus F11]